MQEPGFGLHAAPVEMEAEGVNAGLDPQTRARERHSTARCERASIPMSAGQFRVAAALESLATASVGIVSGWRLMVERLG